MSVDSTDEDYMERALLLAQKGGGFVNPNPQVGAVIVKNGRIIGEGYHEHYGGLHAERNAFAHLTESAEGATLYVTLEPCCHQGQTPPCTEAIIEHGIRRVVIGHGDPNPLVAGKGLALLRQQGIDVVEDVLKEACEKVNKIFFHYISTKMPFVTLKYAMTLDGKIATSTGKSQWITGEAARQKVHEDRSRYMAIMVGIGTVIADDPLLTSRIEKGKNPLRIVCDTQLREQLYSSQILKTAKEIPTIIATGEKDSQKKKQLQEQYGCEMLTLSTVDGHIDLVELIKNLGARGIDSILLEGGARLNASALEAGIVQKVQAYIAPKIFGGQNAPTPVGGEGVSEVAAAYHFTKSEIHRLGDDILLESEIKSCSQAL